MRFKNFTLLFLLGLFGLTAFKAQAQTDATIDPANIRYWIGEGNNEVVFIVNWAEPDTALAWGYRFASESVTLKDVMDGIAEVDYRFSYEANGSWLVDLMFNDGVLDLSLVEQMWVSYLVNGNSTWDTFDVLTLANGDYVKMGDTHCGTLVDPVNYIYVWEKEVAPVYPLAVEARIDASEILYWIGEGEHEVIFAVNWNQPDTCLAWGFRFNEESLTVEEVMDAIAKADNRFAYEGSDGWLTDITYNEGALHLALAGFYWMYNINGVGAMLGYSTQPVVNGDFIKWGDESCGSEIAQWTYVWTCPVTAVTANTSVAEQDLNATLYPNPATSFTMLSLNEMASEVTVTVADLQGRVINRFVAMPGEAPVRLNTENLSTGLYVVNLNDGQRSQTLKLTVK